MMDVIESAWKRFSNKLGDVKDMNELIKIHEEFLAEILSRTLLGPKGKRLYQKLLNVFDLVFRFKHVSDLIFTSANAAF